MKLKIASLLIASCGLASAATVSVSCATDMDFTTNPVSLANELTSAFTAHVGYYSGGVLSTSANFATVNALWTNVGTVNFATGTALSGVSGVNGWFAIPSTTYNSVTSGLGGKNIALWITNGSGDNLVMVSSSTFKNDGDIPNAASVGVSSAAKATWTLDLGTVTTSGANSGFGGSYVLNVVPEPSAALLGAFGALALLRRRRA